VSLYREQRILPKKQNRAEKKSNYEQTDAREPV